MTIPSKEIRAEWRKLAEETMLTSALGEYTPDEFIVLLDAIDKLERRIEELTTEEQI